MPSTRRSIGSAKKESTVTPKQKTVTAKDVEKPQVGKNVHVSREDTKSHATESQAKRKLDDNKNPPIANKHRTPRASIIETKHGNQLEDAAKEQSEDLKPSGSTGNAPTPRKRQKLEASTDTTAGNSPAENVLSPRRSSRAAVPNSKYKDMVDPRKKVLQITKDAVTPKAKVKQSKKPVIKSKLIKSKDAVMTITITDEMDESEITEEVVTEETQIDKQAQLNLIDDPGALKLPSATGDAMPKTSTGTFISAGQHISQMTTVQHIDTGRKDQINAKQSIAKLSTAGSPSSEFGVASKSEDDEDLDSEHVESGIDKSIKTDKMESIVPSAALAVVNKSKGSVVMKQTVKKNVPGVVTVVSVSKATERTTNLPKTISSHVKKASPSVPGNRYKFISKDPHSTDSSVSSDTSSIASSEVNPSVIVIPPVQNATSSLSPPARENQKSVLKIYKKSGNKMVYQQVTDQGKTIISPPGHMETKNTVKGDAGITSGSKRKIIVTSSYTIDPETGKNSRLHSSRMITAGQIMHAPAQNVAKQSKLPPTIASQMLPKSPLTKQQDVPKVVKGGATVAADYQAYSDATQTKPTTSSQSTETVADVVTGISNVDTSETGMSSKPQLQVLYIKSKPNEETVHVITTTGNRNTTNPTITTTKVIEKSTEPISYIDSGKSDMVPVAVTSEAEQLGTDEQELRLAETVLEESNSLEMVAAEKEEPENAEPQADETNPDIGGNSNYIDIAAGTSSDGLSQGKEEELHEASIDESSADISLVKSLCHVIEYTPPKKEESAVESVIFEDRIINIGKPSRYRSAKVILSPKGTATHGRIQPADEMEPSNNLAEITPAMARNAIGSVIAQIDAARPTTSVDPAANIDIHTITSYSKTNENPQKVHHGYIDYQRGDEGPTQIVEISPDVFSKEVYGNTITLDGTTDAGESKDVSASSGVTISTVDDTAISTGIPHIEGLQHTSVVQDSDGVLRIEGLDFSQLSKNSVIMVEKNSEGEETVILHSQTPAEASSKSATSQCVPIHKDTEREETILNPSEGILESSSPLSTTVASHTQGSTNSIGTKTVEYLRPTPTVRTLSNVTITPVKAYNRSEMESKESRSQESAPGTQKYREYGVEVLMPGDRPEPSVVREEEIIQVSSGCVKVIGMNTSSVSSSKDGGMSTGAASASGISTGGVATSEVSTSMTTQTDLDDGSDTDEEPIEITEDGEMVGTEVIHTENPPIKRGRRLEVESPYQEYVIVQLPAGCDIKNPRARPMTRGPIEDRVTVDEDGLYVCVDCDHKTDRKSNWYKHRRKHLGIKPHACTKCTYRAATSSNLKRHMQIHDDVRNFECQICGLYFRQKIHLTRHYKYKHQEKKVNCPLCDYQCSSENPDLKVHIRRRHMPIEGSMDAFTCDTCGLMTVSKKDLKQHMKFHKKGPELKLFCEYCSFVTDCMSRLRRHLCVHTKEKPFQCGLCPYRASQKEHVLRHMRSQHNVEVETRQKRSLLDMRTITKEENVIIPKEGSEIPQVKMSKYKQSESSSDSDAFGPFEKSDFSSQDKIFACNHCSMKFARLINLYKHLYAQHAPVMPNPMSTDHQCVVCDFHTNSKKNLLVHMRKHNTQDHSPPTHVYSCVLCRYINPRRRNLFQHMKKKHGIEIFMKEDGLNCYVTLDSETTKIEGHSPETNEIALSEIVTTEAVDADSQLQIMVNVDGSTFSGEKISIDNIIPIEDIGNYSSVTSEHHEGLVSPQVPAIHTSLQEHEAAEAIEGLQALAEQAGILETQNIDNVMTTEIVSAEMMDVNEIAISSGSDTIIASHSGLDIEVDTATAGMSSGLSQRYDAMEGIETSIEPAIVSEVSADAVGQSDVNAAAASGDDIQLSSEQLNQLSSGDYVEINGEVYKVEIATGQEANTSHVI